MKSWMKPMLPILIIMLLFSLLAELYLGSTIGYDTGGHGKCKNGLYIDGEIEYNIKNLGISGKKWEVCFHNLSNFYLGYFDYNGEINKNIYTTSNLRIIPTPIEELNSYIKIDNITISSKLQSANFKKDGNIELNFTSKNQISGVIASKKSEIPEMEESVFHRYSLEFMSVTILTDNEIITVLDRGWTRLYGITKNIRFRINISKNSIVNSYGGYDTDEIAYINGDLQIRNFDGTIWSNGKLYFRGNPKLSGKMKLNISHESDWSRAYGSDDYWTISIKTEDAVVEGNGSSFWSLGFLISLVPTGIVIIYFIYKKIVDERR